VLWFVLCIIARVPRQLSALNPPLLIRENVSLCKNYHKLFTTKY
jgi:hypothetical protein